MLKRKWLVLLASGAAVFSTLETCTEEVGAALMETLVTEMTTYLTDYLAGLAGTTTT